MKEQTEFTIMTSVASCLDKREVDQEAAKVAQKYFMERLNGAGRHNSFGIKDGFMRVFGVKGDASWQRC